MNEWWLFGVLGILFIIALLIALYPLRKSMFSSIVLIPFLFCLVAIAYWRWGAWPDWQNHLQLQAKKDQVQAMLQSVRGPQELIDKIKARLAKQPNSARGWYLLGKLYASQEQWKLANDAYAKAYQLQPHNEQTTINYAQSL